MGSTQGSHPFSEWDGLFGSMHFGLNGKMNGGLFGQTAKLGQLGDKIGCRIIL